MIVNSKLSTFSFQTFVTAISMSAIATNGVVQGKYWILVWVSMDTAGVVTLNDK